MFSITRRVQRRLASVVTFHCSAVNVAKKKRGKWFNIHNAKDFNVSLHLQQHFESKQIIDWVQMRSSLIGLPINEQSLVSKVNVDSILWEEIVKFGSMDIALDYIKENQITPEKSLHGMVKILREAVILK